MSKAKKNKLKKIKDKYGDQDEEERQMRMLLNGSKEVKDLDYKKLSKDMDKSLAQKVKEEQELAKEESEEE